MIVVKRVTRVIILLSLLLLLFALFSQVGAERLLIQPLPDGPSQREDHSAIYDSEHNEAIFFGGGGPDSCLNDVWRLRLSDLSWTQVSVTGNIPSARQGHSAIYDPVNRRMLIFAGANPYYIFNDLHSLDLNSYTWSELLPSGTLPSPRWNHSSVYNPTDSSMIIFGGRDMETRLNDLWKLDLNTLTWTEISPVGEVPPVREYHTATYIPDGNYMVVYAGYAEEGDYDDLWKYDFATNSWSPILPSGEKPLLRAAHSAFYNSSNNCLIIFGGNDHSLRYFGDIWKFDLNSSTWEQLSPYLGRSHQAGIYDPQRQGILIFGGWTYHTNYFFSDGYVITIEDILPFSYGDANCDGDITILDVVYTINYLFKGGPAPCSPSAR